MGIISQLCVFGVLMAVLLPTTWQMADESRLSLEGTESVKSFVSKRKRQDDGITLIEKVAKKLSDKIPQEALKKVLDMMKDVKTA